MRRLCTSWPPAERSSRSSCARAAVLRCSPRRIHNSASNAISSSSRASASSCSQICRTPVRSRRSRSSHARSSRRRLNRCRNGANPLGNGSSRCKRCQSDNSCCQAVGSNRWLLRTARGNMGACGPCCRRRRSRRAQPFPPPTRRQGTPARGRFPAKSSSLRRSQAQALAQARELPDRRRLPDVRPRTLR